MVCEGSIELGVDLIHLGRQVLGRGMGPQGHMFSGGSLQYCISYGRDDAVKAKAGVLGRKSLCSSDTLRWMWTIGLSEIRAKS